MIFTLELNNEIDKDISIFPFNLEEIRKLNDNYSGIYAIINLNNNFVYIGQAKNIKGRLKSHLSAIINLGTNSNRRIKRDYIVTKGENFCFSILEEMIANREIRLEFEEEWIKRIPNCYNNSPIGYGSLDKIKAIWVENELERFIAFFDYISKEKKPLGHSYFNYAGIKKSEVKKYIQIIEKIQNANKIKYLESKEGEYLVVNKMRKNNGKYLGNCPNCDSTIEMGDPVPISQTELRISIECTNCNYLLELYDRGDK